MRLSTSSPASRRSSIGARAAYLYRSDWFRKAHPHVEEAGERWFVLSAAHGVVKPPQRLDPDDVTRPDLTASERRLWGEKAVRLRRAIGARYRGPVVFLAGRFYREPLLGFAGDRAVVPMLGMGIGQQKAWLAVQIAEQRERVARARHLDLFTDQDEPPVTLDEREQLQHIRA